MTEQVKEKREIRSTRKFQTVAELQKAIDKYMERQKAEKRPLTVCGLALAIGTDRKTLNNYQDMEDKYGESYLPTIKNAKQMIEESLEELLLTKHQMSGVIFNLKNNFGWRDAQEITSYNTNDNVNYTASDLVLIDKCYRRLAGNKDSDKGGSDVED